MVHQRQQRRQFTCTLDSGRLIFTATSSRMKMSGYLVLENSPSRTSSWARVKVVRSRRCFRWFMPVRIKQREKKVRKARLGCTRFGETFDRRRLVRGHDSVIFVDPPPPPDHLFGTHVIRLRRGCREYSQPGTVVKRDTRIQLPPKTTPNPRHPPPVAQKSDSASDQHTRSLGQTAREVRSRGARTSSSWGSPNGRSIPRNWIGRARVGTGRRTREKRTLGRGSTARSQRRLECLPSN
jgi:hypothetical protein